MALNRRGRKVLELIASLDAGHDSQVNAQPVNRLELQSHSVRQGLQGSERRHALARPEQLGRQVKHKLIDQPGAWLSSPAKSLTRLTVRLTPLTVIEPL